MTLSPNVLLRSTGAIAAAVFYSALTMGALIAPTQAEARGNAVYYTAELAAPAAEETAIVGGVVWRCEGTSCVAGKGNSRPIVMCARAAREFGEITAFTAKGKELAEEKLAKCND
ncbi:hypothetical protein GRI43_09265 [Altererythrobacter luteolus]|uniref:Uncharacterized protein n=1 Tax=Pontixanthobacter luteolus TaxID=295089 RepID=A0A6I4V053_9SPHN|nr:hypothetical protein [Pontixanthobacter luteolus]MXP47567.1 hypothetical protein [Pontixanthobacter luteolus]